MGITPLSGVFSGASTHIQRTAQRIQTVLGSIASGNKPLLQDVAGLSIAAQLSNQLAGLKSAAGNIAQALSVTQVAGQAVGQQQEIVSRLQALATQANSGSLTDADREALNTEFQSLVEELGRISGNTNFSGQALLDGTFELGLDTDAGSSTLSIADLSPEALFGGLSPDILTQENAAAALAALATASDTLTASRAGIGGFESALGYESAQLESAIFNQDAALSELSDTDLADASTQLSLLKLQENAAIATQAQANKLAPRILDLLNDDQA